MRKIRFAAVSRNYFNMPIWVASDLGFMQEEGIELEIELHESIDEVTRRTKDRRVDLAFGVTEQVILDSEAGGDLTIVAGNVNKLPFSLIARKGLGSIQDLRGKTIGVSAIEAGSSSLVMQLLSAHGLHYPGDYTLRAVGPILTRWRMLQSGEIDAGLQGAPLNRIAMDQGFPTLAEPRKMFPHFTFTSLNTDAHWAQENRDLLVRFLRAFIRAHRWYFENREKSSEVATSQSGIPQEYALAAWDEYTSNEIFPPDGDISTAGVAALIEISSQIRALPSRAKTSADDYIDRNYWKEAIASL